MTKYNEVKEEQYGDYSPDNECIFGYVTREVVPGDAFYYAVMRMVNSYHISKAGKVSYTNYPQILMTTEECWSGYSDVTITSTWNEIIITVPDWEIALRYEKLSKFLIALADFADEQ